MDLQRKLDTARISKIGIQITQRQCEEFIYLKASGIKIKQLQADKERLEGIIVRFKAGCKITGKGPIDANCEMVEQLQAKLVTTNKVLKSMNEQWCSRVDRVIELHIELDTHRWIPVEERLPEDTNHVWLCYIQNDYTYNGYYDGTYWNIFNYSGGYTRVSKNPTHWKSIILPTIKETKT